MDVISLGFPEQTIPKWLNGYVYEWVQDGLLRCYMRKTFDEVEFHNWKEVVSVNVGVRINDLYRMTKRSIIDGAVEYMPRKTKDGNPVVVRVPLLTATKEILDKYKDLPGDAILPLVSQQKYNIAIKKILKYAGIERIVTVLNPTTSEPEQRPIYEVLSSHCARKAFSGNMYDKVPDPNLICPLTGHKEGSKAFNRYRKIDEDTNRKTVSLLE